jgi:hypothetical protein
MLHPALRKFTLTLHVGATVGWLGSVVAFLALAAVGLTSDDPQTVRGVYLVMEPVAWLVLVPLAFASLLTGVVQSLASAWGLFRHYWVVFKLVITAAATLVLVSYMQTFSRMSQIAADSTIELDHVRNVSPALHAALALAGLLAALVLSIYKPRGLTPYGQRKQRQ